MAVERDPGGNSLIDVLDRVLDKGIVIDAWVRVSLVGIDLVTVEARIVVASIDTYLRFSEAVGITAPSARPRRTDVLMSRFYPGHPYGRRPRGTPQTVEKIGREELATFHRRWFTPEGTTVVVVGDVDADQMIRSVTRACQSWTVERPPDPCLRR